MTQYPEAYLCRELGMAVVNIALITDYDAGVIEGTEAVDARSVLEVFAQNAERIQKVVLEMIGRFPADLDALGARQRLSTPGETATRRRPRTSACSRRGCRSWSTRSRRRPAVHATRHRSRSGSTSARSARSRPGGSRARYAWTRPAMPGCGAGTTSWAAAISRSRSSSPDDARHGRGSDPTGDGCAVRRDVMNRHPALLARMAGTLQIASGGRLILGMGIGGAPREHAAYGIPSPRGIRAGQPPRGGGRDDPRPVDGWSRDARFGAVPARQGNGVSRPGSGAPDRDRRRNAQRSPARRADRRRVDALRRDVHHEPPAVPRDARR